MISKLLKCDKMLKCSNLSKPADEQALLLSFQHCLLCPSLPPPSDLAQGVDMSTTAFMPLRFLAQTQLFSVSLSITLPSTPSKRRTYTKGTRLRVDKIAGCHGASAQASTEKQRECEKWRHPSIDGGRLASKRGEKAALDFHLQQSR